MLRRDPSWETLRSSNEENEEPGSLYRLLAVAVATCGLALVTGLAFVSFVRKSPLSSSHHSTTSMIGPPTGIPVTCLDEGCRDSTFTASSSYHKTNSNGSQKKHKGFSVPSVRCNSNPKWSDHPHSHLPLLHTNSPRATSGHRSRPKENPTRRRHCQVSLVITITTILDITTIMNTGKMFMLDLTSTPI